MSKSIAKKESAPLSAQTVSNVILYGDLSHLNPQEKVVYYNKVCETVGLNPLTKPFDYIKLNGKEVLYANKGCAEQLRQVHGVSISVKSCQTIQGVYVVVVEASDKNGRTDSATGAVPIEGLKGDALANVFMKCETKAKRRATLSICGLNMLDETEVMSVAGAEPPHQAPVIKPEPQKAAEPQVMPKENKAHDRDMVGQEIVSLKKAKKLTNDELTEWAHNMFQKNSLKDLTLDELRLLRDDLKKGK